MNDERLDELLRCADADAPMILVAPGLAARVRRTARRRSRMRKAAGAAIVALAAGSSLLLLPRPSVKIAQLDRHPIAPATNIPLHHAPLNPKADSDPARLREEYAILCAQAKDHEHAATLIMQARARAEQRARIISALAKPDVLQELTEQRNRAAKILLDYGDSLGDDPAGRAAAAQAYRQAATLFPDSPCGANARKRIEHMKA